MRVCSTCGEARPLDEFYKDAQRPDGIALRCRICRANAYNKYVAKWNKTRKTLPAEKLCKKCGKILPTSAFAKDSHTPSGISFYCRACRGKTGKISRERVKRDPIKRTQQNQRSRLRPYGLSLAEFEALKSAQSGQCSICGEIPKKGLHIDHCHKSKAIRGLLCELCNKAIGLFKDNPDLCTKAAEYLQR